MSRPSLRRERALLRARGGTWLAGVDEVGRGALAGPVTVGVVLIAVDTPSAPTGLRDSKLLSRSARAELLPRLQRWAPYAAVGHAESAEIDALGMTAALRTAGRRALAQLPLSPDVVLLDGSHDWLSWGSATLFDAEPEPDPYEVTTLIKADLQCTAVAAASVLAKTARDSIMTAHAAAFPHYGWEFNMGYAAPGHWAGLQEHGPCALHRQSWKPFQSNQFEAASGAVDWQEEEVAR